MQVDKRFKQLPPEAIVPSDVQGALQTAFHAGHILLGGYLVAQTYSNGGVLYWASTIVLAFFYSFLFMPLHEAVHETVFQTRLGNTMLMWATGVLTFRPPRHYYYYHWDHHLYTGVAKKDPELQDTFLDMRVDSVWSYALYLSGLPFWADRLLSLCRHAGMLKMLNVFGDSQSSAVPKQHRGVFNEHERYLYRTERAAWRVRNEAQLFMALYLTVGVLGTFVWPGLGGAVWRYWLLPTILGQPFLRYYLLAEHRGCQGGDEQSPEQYLGHFAANTRTTLTYWWYCRLAWNMPCHSEHHAFPKVPFYSLPALYELNKGYTVRESACNPNGSVGYTGVHKALVASFGAQ